MGGDVLVETEVGNGSEFIIRLPHARSSGLGRSEEQRPATVVLLHPSPEVLEGPEFEPNGRVRVLATTDPLRAVALVRQELPELVSLDLSCANDGAWRVLSGIRGDRLHGATRTLLLLPSAEGPGLSLEVGGFFVVPKPISIENTLDAVTAVCGRLEGVSAVLADPDPDVRRILGEALASAGCAVRGVEDGDEALEALARGTTNVAIFNLIMPRLDAISTIARMRADNQLRDIPVILLVPHEMTPQEIETLRTSASILASSGAATTRPTLDLVHEHLEWRAALTSANQVV